MGTEAKTSGPPPPWGNPELLPRGSCRGGPGRSGPRPSQLPARKGFGEQGARGAPHPARPHPARAPQSAPGAARAILAAPAAASARAESRRRWWRPDPLAPRLPRPPAAGQSRPCRLCPPGASSRRRLSPAPPPTPARLEGKGGGRGRLPPPHSHPLRLSPTLLHPHARRHAGIWSAAGAGLPRGAPHPGLQLPIDSAHALGIVGFVVRPGPGGSLPRRRWGRGGGGWEISMPRRLGSRCLKQREVGSAVARPRVEYLDSQGDANCRPGCLSDAAVASCGRARLKGKPLGPRTPPRVQFPLALPKSHDLRPAWLRAWALQAGRAVVGPLRSGERRRGSRSELRGRGVFPTREKGSE